MKKLILKAGRDKSLRRRHPWIFSGAVARVEGDPAPGDTVEVRSDAGAFLAVAAYSPESQIRARVWDWQDRSIDRAFFDERIRRAVAARVAPIAPPEAGQPHLRCEPVRALSPGPASLSGKWEMGNGEVPGVAAPALSHGNGIPGPIEANSH